MGKIICYFIAITLTLIAISFGAIIHSKHILEKKIQIKRNKVKKSVDNVCEIA